MNEYIAELVGEIFVLVFGGGERYSPEATSVLKASPSPWLVAVGDGVHHRPDLGLSYQPGSHLRSTAGQKTKSKTPLPLLSRRSWAGLLARPDPFHCARGTGRLRPSVAGLGANGYGVHSPGQYSLAAAFLAEVILTMFLVLTVLGSTNVSPGRIRRRCHRPGVNADSPGWHSHHQHLGESRAEHWAGDFCGGMGTPTVVAVHCRTADRRCGGGRHLWRHSGAGCGHHHSGGGASAGE